MRRPRKSGMTIRIGMMGAGRMSNVHAHCLAKIQKAKIVAVADVLPERAQSLAERADAAVYTDYGAMLDNEKLDAVYICTPSRPSPWLSVVSPSLWKSR